MQITNSRRRSWRPLVWGLVIALGAVSAVAGKVDRRHPGKLSAKARDDAGRKGGARMDVLVRFRKTPGAAENALVKAFGGSVRRPLKSSSRWMSLRLPASVVAKLAENAIVEFVASDPLVGASLDSARQTSNEPQASQPESAFKGAGVTIAEVDSGVALHPDIQTLVAAADIVNPASVNSLLTGDAAVTDSPLNSIDPNGHGTHVAGILVGTGSHSPDGRLAGIAPQASLVSVRVLDDQGHGTSSDVLAGLQWVLDHKDQYGIRVLNLSLGHPIYEPAATDPLVQAVDALWDAGIVVVCSAGNNGHSGYGTISSPCNSRKVITVGATNDHHTADLGDDNIATYSSRGPAPIDLVAKPDIVAPGNRIVSTRSAGSYIDGLFPERRVAADPSQPGVQEYVEMSGTSMASPMVAGAAALMIQQDPTLNPATVKARLMLSARKTAVGHPFATGAGALDILAALQATGTVAQAPSPVVAPDAGSGQISVENTAVLWGNDAFSLMNVWSSAVIWSDPTQYAQPILWTEGVLWPDGQLVEDASLWPDSALWPEACLWPDLDLWSEAALWPDDAGPVDILPEAVGIQDP